MIERTHTVPGERNEKHGTWGAGYFFFALYVHCPHLPFSDMIDNIICFPNPGPLSDFGHQESYIEMGRRQKDGLRVFTPAVPSEESQKADCAPQTQVTAALKMVFCMTPRQSCLSLSLCA